MNQISKLTVFLMLVSAVSAAQANNYWAGDRIIEKLYVQDDNTVLVEIANPQGMSVCAYAEGAIIAHLRLVSETVARQNLFSVLLAAKASSTKIAINYSAPISSGNCSRDELPKMTQVSIQ